MKKIAILSIFVFACSTLFGQPEHELLREKKEKMDAMKAAYITEKIDLSSKESQDFWPLYNEMDKKIEKLRMATMDRIMKLRREGKDIDATSEEELKSMMTERLDNDEKIVRIKKEYHAKYLKTLGVKKTAKLYQAEKDFARELMRKSRRMPPKEKGRPGER